MLFVIYREHLLKALRAVAAAVGSKQKKAILANVLLKVEGGRLVVCATDEEVELMDVVELIAEGDVLPGKITIPFKKIYDVCRALPDKTKMYFKEEANKVNITATNSRFSLLTQSAEEFPSVDLSLSKEKFKLAVSKKEFKSLLEQTAFAMAEQDVRHFLKGMLIESRENKLFAVAADGHRLAMHSIELSQNLDSFRIIIPRKGILGIMRALEGKDEQQELLITVGNKHIQMQIDNLVVICKLLEGNFPDYDNVIPTVGDKVIEGCRAKLKAAFQRASTLFCEKARGVKLSFKENSMKISAKNQELDETEERLEIDYSGEPIEISFNARYLIDFLSVVKSEKVRLTFNNPNDGALIQGVDGSGGNYVLMPVRV